MKNKLIISFAIFALILISIVFANSYVQALSKEEKLQMEKEILEQKIENSKITEKQADQIYKNMEENMANCNNICQQNEICPIYTQTGNCIKQNHHDLQKICNGTRNCGKYQGCHNR